MILIINHSFALGLLYPGQEDLFVKFHTISHDGVVHEYAERTSCNVGELVQHFESGFCDQAGTKPRQPTPIPILEHFELQLFPLELQQGFCLHDSCRVLVTDALYFHR